MSQEQIRVILWWQQGSRKKIQTSLSSARSHVQLYKIGSCQINDDKVSIVHFHVLMSFYSIYAILSQIQFCRDLRFFFVNFWGQKLLLRNFFDKYDVCSSTTLSNCPPAPAPPAPHWSGFHHHCGQKFRLYLSCYDCALIAVDARNRDAALSSKSDKKIRAHLIALNATDLNNCCLNPIL